MKKSALLVFAAAFTVLGVIGFWMLRLQAPGATDGPSQTLPAGGAARVYALRLHDAQGKLHSLDQWRGRILVVNYWATWCHPCKEEMPGFSRLHDKYLAKGVQFVGISVDTADKISEFQNSTPVSYPLLIGDMTTMAQSAELGNSRQALPFTAVFNREGELVMTKLGRWNEADLEPRLRQLLGA